LIPEFLKVRAPTVFRKTILKLHPGCIAWIPEVVAKFDSSDFLITQIVNMIFLFQCLNSSVSGAIAIVSVNGQYIRNGSNLDYHSI
jgi:hypothetical protein